ncbi:MAG: hypothetical protein ACFFFC_06185 [Candidatus Thorarchaeota archaeon]
MGENLIRSIQYGTWGLMHDCRIACNSLEGMFTVIDFLNNESVEDFYYRLPYPRIHVFLTAEQIYTIARMAEVTSIRHPSTVTVVTP